MKILKSVIYNGEITSSYLYKYDDNDVKYKIY